MSGYAGEALFLVEYLSLYISYCCFFCDNSLTYSLHLPRHSIQHYSTHVLSLCLHRVAVEISIMMRDTPDTRPTESVVYLSCRADNLSTRPLIATTDG